MTDKLSTREAVRIELVRSAVQEEGALERAFVQALHLSAGALGVARVGIWFAEDDWSHIKARMTLDARTMRLRSGETIDLRTCPRCAAALRSRRAVVADDALADPNTNELDDYLKRNAIGAILDSPIFLGGELVGIVCHEHIGGARIWSKQDVDFVTTVSDMLGLYLQQDETRRTSETLLATRRELEQARVMESLGRLAAGVAHDFNNILGAIAMKVDLYERKSATESATELAADVRTMVGQGSRLVRQLLTFARSEPVPPGHVDLGRIVRESVPTLRMAASKDVTLAVTIPENPLPVRLEQSRAEQVLMNLVVNARDAMLGGGKLEIELSRAPNEVVLTVRDTGVGMDGDTRERIFEPFFTTKEMGQGTGLGLATVYGIVTEASGRIEVESAVGEGTTFRVHLPLEGA